MEEVIKKKRRIKPLEEQYDDAMKKLEKIKKDIEKQKQKNILNFFSGISNDKSLLDFVALNSKNKELQEKVYSMIKKEFIEVNNSEEGINTAND